MLFAVVEVHVVSFSGPMVHFASCPNLCMRRPYSGALLSLTVHRVVATFCMVDLRVSSFRGCMLHLVDLGLSDTLTMLQNSVSLLRLAANLHKLHWTYFFEMPVSHEAPFQTFQTGPLMILELPSCQQGAPEMLPLDHPGFLHLALWDLGLGLYQDLVVSGAQTRCPLLSRGSKCSKCWVPNTIPSMAFNFEGALCHHMWALGPSEPG